LPQVSHFAMAVSPEEVQAERQRPCLRGYGIN
jgi:hypothetical protein